MKKSFLLLVSVTLAAGFVQAREGTYARPALISPGGLPVLFNSQGPLSYPSLTFRQIPKDAVLLGTVTGHSCQASLSIPLFGALAGRSVSGALGNGSYAKILGQMERQHPRLRGIYDVKVDMHVISILGIVGQLCTDVKAQGFR